MTFVIHGGTRGTERSAGHGLHRRTPPPKPPDYAPKRYYTMLQSAPSCLKHRLINSIECTTQAILHAWMSHLDYDELTPFYLEGSPIAII